MADKPTPTAGLVDAHVHFWDTAAFPLPWLASVPELAQRYNVSDLVAAAGSSPLGAVVAVQAGPTYAERQWLLAQAGREPLIGAVVVQVDPERGLWADPLGWRGGGDAAVSPAGVRLPVHRLASEWWDLDGLGGFAVKMAARDQVCEVLLRPDQLDSAVRLAGENPLLTIVLCHLALGTRKPDAAWREGMRRVAESPNVYAKVSGLFARGGDESARSAIGSALELLGPDRLLFGSDWPLSSRIGTYEDILDRTIRACGALSSAQERAVWGETDVGLYSPRGDD